MLPTQKLFAFISRLDRRLIMTRDPGCSVCAPGGPAESQTGLQLFGSLKRKHGVELILRAAIP